MSSLSVSLNPACFVRKVCISSVSKPLSACFVRFLSVSVNSACLVTVHIKTPYFFCLSLYSSFARVIAHFVSVNKPWFKCLSKYSLYHLVVPRNLLLGYVWFLSWSLYVCVCCVYVCLNLYSDHYFQDNCDSDMGGWWSYSHHGCVGRGMSRRTFFGHEKELPHNHIETFLPHCQNIGFSSQSYSCTKKSNSEFYGCGWSLGVPGVVDQLYIQTLSSLYCKLSYPWITHSLLSMYTITL